MHCGSCRPKFLQKQTDEFSQCNPMHLQRKQFANACHILFHIELRHSSVICNSLMHQHVTAAMMILQPEQQTQHTKVSSKRDSARTCSRNLLMSFAWVSATHSIPWRNSVLRQCESGGHHAQTKHD